MGQKDQATAITSLLVKDDQLNHIRTDLKAGQLSRGTTSTAVRDPTIHGAGL